LNLDTRKKCGILNFVEAKAARTDFYFALHKRKEFEFTNTQEATL
jgi:hypothetical protein